jgi:hypothetical protein
MTVMRLHLVLLCAALVTAQCNNHGVPDGRICKCDDAFLPPFCHTEATRLVLESSWPYELRWAVHPEQGTIDMAIMFGGHSCWAGLGSLFKFSLLPSSFNLSGLRQTSEASMAASDFIVGQVVNGRLYDMLFRLGRNCAVCACQIINGTAVVASFHPNPSDPFSPPLPNGDVSFIANSGSFVWKSRFALTAGCRWCDRSFGHYVLVDSSIDASSNVLRS